MDKVDDPSICNYLREFKKKSCQAYKPDKNHTGRNKCTCGLYREDHECIGRFPQQPSDQYVHLPTDAYGSIEFIDQVHGFQNAKYIRLANDTKMDKVARLLRDVWKLIDNKQLPDVILSIGGGVKEYRPNKILEEKFHATLINAAENNNVWLLTCGAFVGVSKNVGEAMFESFFEQWACNDRIKKPNNLKCIGVAPWGYIADSNKLINDPENNLNPKKYSVNALVERGKPTSLDPYHTHFLLVDDGSHGRYGTEIEFRAMLEAYLTKNLADQGEKVQIPTVYVVLEGGPDIFTAVAERLKREVPVIVIEGSGRASSIIAYAVRSCEERNNEYKLTMDQERLLRKMIGKIFRFLKDDNRRMEELLGQIRIIIKQKNWTQLVNLSQKEDIATAIANLWIKVKEKEYSNTTENNNSTTAEKKDSITAKNLKFALKWGCANLARDQIEKMSSYELSSENCWTLIEESISNNRVECIAVLLEKLVNIDDFLTIAILKNMLNKLLLPNGAAHVDYKKAFEFLKMMKSSQDNYNTYLYPWIIAEKTVQDGHNRIHCDTDVFHHLFVLCVLSQRFEMAMKIWERSSHQIATALVGKKLVDSIIAQINFKRDTSELQEMSGKFQDKAVELLETCYQNRLSLTSILITTPIPAWGGNNCLRLAASSEATTFIAHVCCQHWLENEWVGNTTAKIKGREEGSSKADFNCNHFKDSCLKSLHEIWKFLNVPRNKFFISWLFYIGFLVLYAIMILLQQLQPQISSLEIALLIWQSTIFIEFSLKFLGSNKLRSKPQKKIKRLYKLETINILLFWLCLLRFFSSLFEVARIFYCFNFAVYTVRILSVCNASVHLGPRLLILKSVTKEIGFFLLLLVIFMISYSVANFGILQASQTPQQTIYSLFAVPYWNMFGELDIDRITGMDQGCFLSNRTIGIDGKPCPRNIWLALLMLAIYMIITNVLLLNLLIAVFNNIFTEVDQNSKELWKYHRYEMILKYKRKSPFPSPFSIIGILINCCRGKLGAVDQEGPSTAKQREHKLFLKFEVNCYRQMLRKNLVASELGTTKENEKSSYADEIDAQVDVSDSENSSERQATNRADNNSKTSITCV